MKILLIITGLSMGGAEKVVTSLADAFAAKGHDVSIAYMTGEGEILPSNNRIRVISLGMRGIADVLITALKLRRLIREFRPDVVHTHMFHANILTRLVRLVTPISHLISTAHSSDAGGRCRILIYRLTDWLADISTNVSEEAVASFIQAKATFPGRMVAMHNAISTEIFAFNSAARLRCRQELFIDPNHKLILAVGRLHIAKDYPNLFRAVAKLRDIAPNFTLCVVGHGSLRNNLVELSKELGIADYVQFLGVRRDVADLMSAADVFVLSSAWEGFGLVVAEAMACERVVVATDCGGVREVVGDTGYLVMPKDDDLLAQALLRAMRLPAWQSKAIGQDARRRIIDLYKIDAVVAKWLQIYSR